jgi:Reverse transcriptase (RNA-dependent DNA polymerase)
VYFSIRANDHIFIFARSERVEPYQRHPGKTPHELWYGKKPDVAHLRPFGCTAYARVPEEVIGGKLNDQSIKCVLLGYFGRDGYRLLDRSTGRIFRSRDVIFEEGVAHRTLDTGSLTAGEQLSDDEDHVTLSEPGLSNTPSIQDDERAQGLVPAHLSAPTIPITPIITPPATVETPVPRRSTRNTVPTRAINESRESEQHIGQARRDGEEWAKMVTINAFLTHLDDTAALLIDPENNWIPNSYTEAMTRPDLWKEPMDKEITNMHAHQVWTLVDRPSDIKPMQNRWTFANKYDVSGKLVGRKARLVAKGFTQIPGVDYFETYASVVRYELLRMNLAIAAAKDMETWQVDYVGAYLNANNQAPTYMEEPEGYKTNPGKVCRVTKALYGTMDGATNWFEALHEEMGELGYYQSKADPSVRSRHANGEVTITSTYTDDVTGISSMTVGAKVAREELGWKYEVKDLGEASCQGTT